MSLGNWKDIAELVGIAAVIASLIFVGVQIKQEEQTATSDYVSNYSGRAGLLSEMIADHSVAWHKACSGEEMSEGERTVASQIYIRYYMHSYLTWLLYRAGLNQVEDDTPAEWFANSIWRHLGFRNMYQEHMAKNSEQDLVDGIFDVRFAQFNSVVDDLVRRKSATQARPDNYLTLCGASF